MRLVTRRRRVAQVPERPVHRTPDRRPPQPELGGSSHRPRHPRLRCEEVLDGLINEYRAVAKKAMVTAVIEYLHPTGLAELNLADRGLGL